MGIKESYTMHHVYIQHRRGNCPDGLTWLHCIWLLDWGTQYSVAYYPANHFKFGFIIDKCMGEVDKIYHIYCWFWTQMNHIFLPLFYLGGMLAEFSSDWHGWAKPAGFPGKGLSGKGKSVHSITWWKPLPGRQILAGISQNGKLAH